MADFRTANLPPEQAEPAARKGASEENFPVASRLIPKRLRPHIMAFYAFVRLADDIADDPHLDPEIKVAQLDALERALVSGIGGQSWLAPALQLKASLTATGVSGLHARQVLQAFRRDAQGGCCKGWSDMLLYCRYSANPVGRYLLELHREGMNAAPASDALCTALQVLNHIQDCRSDWVDLGRCYLPTDWFGEAGGNPEQLVEKAATPAVRAVIDRCLDQVDALLDRAATLPRLVADPGLRMETAVIIRLARALSRRLRRTDPLARRVEVGAFGKAAAAMGGVAEGLLARPPRSEAADGRKGRGSTFYWPLRLLPTAKRQAMFAIYAFCRHVDDIADEPGPLEARQAALAGWRRNLDAVYAGVVPRGGDAALLAGLGAAVRRYRLPRAEFDAMIDGMAMDLNGPIRAPDLQTLTLYCRRVAGAAGLLSVRVFGEESDARTDAFAIALGEALQLTNILRDLQEDARIGRLYLPRELLEAAGIAVDEGPGLPEAVLGHRSLPDVCEGVAELAECRFAAARTALASLDAKALWPAVAMMLLYRRLLTRLRARGWHDLGDRPRLSAAEKVGVALRCALGRPPKA